MAHLMFVRPEREYWRIDRPQHEAESMSFGWRKLKWAAALWVNPRGIKWSQQIRGVRRGDAPVTRWHFVVYQLRRYLTFYFIVDAMMVYTLRHFYYPGVDMATLTVRATSWSRSLYNSWHVLLSVIAQLQFQYLVCSGLTVAIGIYDPEDWPEWLGSFQDLSSVRLFWNAWEHQIIRRTFMLYSRAFVSFLDLRRGSNLDQYTRIYFSFFLSGIFHGVTNFVMPANEGEPRWVRFRLQFIFYMLQPFAIQFEDLVKFVYKHLIRMPKKRSDSHDPKGKGDTSEPLETSVGVTWTKIISHMWVICWVWFSMGWAGDALLKSGVARLTPLPVPIVERVLIYADGNVWFHTNVTPWVRAWLGKVGQ
ncbi:uncharacterized protein JN550_009212 [Neoarthrinium moseri]|uniref:uncharacterized protein n=1 Tax=Neoarthrinium moseri TaxID=1658444 RepID=UPI001FDB0E0D|nr:uncharacterized protein JN550_009212 [Neoarthrinium moseri]KAI1863933.1 hypothetical protein JN550_009212 [Neoarthrinium moseri]